MGLGESVTWRAKHFGVYQNLTSKITEFKEPDYFVDEMLSGAFKSFKHEHHFKKTEGGTLMIDIFEYQSPFGFLGKLVDNLFLEKYMSDFNRRRSKRACRIR
ncbi:MAG: ligand-binding SRPBCC domain-containing protein [Arcticibacterium sp.]|jgi:ligand-binding SRPBCC domain-containing protein